MLLKNRTAVFLAIAIAVGVALAQEPSAPPPATPTTPAAPGTAATANTPATQPGLSVQPPEPAAPAEEVSTIPAQNAALAWLALIDAGSYGLSWDQGSETFRAAIKRDDWEKALAAVRGPLGELRGRKLRQMRYANGLPKAPPGEYVVILFDTQFGERPSLETVTPMLDKDGTWRVAGYHIR